MFPYQNNPSVSMVQTGINCMLHVCFVFYSLFLFYILWLFSVDVLSLTSCLIAYSPPLALAALVSLLFLGHSLRSECRYQNAAQALLNLMPKLAWFLNQPSDTQLERQFCVR